MNDDPDLTAELDAAEAIVMGGATVKTEWGSRDAAGEVFNHGAVQASAERALRYREHLGHPEVLVRRTVTYGPWTEVPGES